ncbi:MAG: hypothetical protein Q8P87_00155, partial [bacterium]|nr:hypothetical protein [bacterium]
IFTIGAANLNALGNIYQVNAQAFSGTHIVDIDIQSANTSFGQTNIVDSQASSLSEVVASVIADLGFVLDSDVASNLLAGVFDTTNNLLGPKVTADTYMAVANCLRVGGRKPSAGVAGQVVPVSSIPQQPTYDWNAVSAAIGQTKAPQVEPVSEFTVPPVVSPTGDQNQPSPEERPLEEGVVSETVEPEWLTPKIFKGTSLG